MPIGYIQELGKQRRTTDTAFFSFLLLGESEYVVLRIRLTENWIGVAVEC